MNSYLAYFSNDHDIQLLNIIARGRTNILTVKTCIKIVKNCLKHTITTAAIFV